MGQMMPDALFNNAACFMHFVSLLLLASAGLRFIVLIGVTR